MLRDNLAGLIEPMLSSAGAYPLALATDRKELSDDRPQYALKIPARQGGIYALTENVASPFHAEPRQLEQAGPYPRALPAPKLVDCRAEALRRATADTIKTAVQNLLSLMV